MYNMVIIDDEDIVIDGLTSVIDWQDHQINIVGTATNGQRGLDLILEKKPDIVLTDIRMPGLSGLQVIEESKKLLPDTVFVIISGHAEFHYAKSAIELDVIDYLIKPVDIDDIVKVIKKSIAKNEKNNKELLKGKQIEDYKSKLVEKYLLDEMLGFETNDVNLELDFKHFTVLYTGLKTKGPIESNDINRIISQIKTFLIDVNVKVFPYFMDDKIIIIIGSKSENRNELFITNEISTVIENILPFSPIIGIGSTYEGKSKISQSYKESQQAFKLGLFINQNIVLFSDVSKHKSSVSPIKIRQIEVFFKDEALNFHRICQFIDELVDHTKVEKLSPNSFKKICYEFINQLEKFIQREYEVDVEQFFREKSSMYEQLQSLSSIEDYKELLKETIRPIFDYVERNRISPKEKVILDVKKYLEENYGKVIQLDEIADSFYISSSYLSNLFSKIVGTTISEYLIEVRMNKAKELLRTTNYKIEKISKMVGYENSRYFNQVFKKNVKTTPSSYRSQHLIHHSVNTVN